MKRLPNVVPYAVALLGLMFLVDVFDRLSVVAGFAFGSIMSVWMLRNASYGKRGGL